MDQNPIRPSRPRWRRGGGQFGERIAALDAEAVIDLTCYRLESAQQLVEALHRPHRALPALRNDLGARPLGRGSHDGRRTARALRRLRRLASMPLSSICWAMVRSTGFPATILHPGHLVGPRMESHQSARQLQPEVFATLAADEELTLPNLGMETVHHVHADDVAQAFLCALSRTAGGHRRKLPRRFSAAPSRFAATPSAWLRGSASPRRYALCPGTNGRHPSSERDARVTFDHIAHSPNCSIEKARSLLGYAPRYSSLEAVEESVTEMQRSGTLQF